MDRVARLVGAGARRRVGTDVEADDRSPRRFGKADVGFAYRANAGVQHAYADFFVANFFHRLNDRFGRALHVGLDQDRQFRDVLVVLGLGHQLFKCRRGASGSAFFLGGIGIDTFAFTDQYPFETHTHGRNKLSLVLLVNLFHFSRCYVYLGANFFFNKFLGVHLFAQPFLELREICTLGIKSFQKLLFDMFNPAGFLTGPAEITEFDAASGSATMEVPDCAWHICAKQESLPNPKALPEQGCLLICKGAFEALFDGSEGGLKMEFDPHLPETSCSVKMSWKAAQNPN